MIYNYSIFGDLFRYPDYSTRSKLLLLHEFIAKRYPKGIKLITTFIEYLYRKKLDEQQEYYIKTFDVQASCYLDIGYILFGEDYKRGEFLVNLNKEHKTADNDCGSELADHLPNLLSLLDKTSDKKFAEELAYCLMIPAIKEMHRTFVDKGNIYIKCLELILLVLEEDFGTLGYEQFKISPNTKNCFLEKGKNNRFSCGQIPGNQFNRKENQFSGHF